MTKKLTIIANGDGGHQQELLDAALARGFDVSIKNLTAKDVSTGKAKRKLGDMVIWRSSKLDVESERTSLLPIVADKTIASDGVFHYPMIRFKYFQQQFLASHSATAKWSMPTYRFKTASGFKKAIDDNILTLPVIAKPNAGSRGEGIFLLETIEDINEIAQLKKYIFQGYIPNDCDWRVIVVGGSAIGVLRREAAKGSYLNNVSQGAYATAELDDTLSGELAKIATKVASLFHLAFCGVDIIRNKQTGELSVLEVNTAPQWRDEYGFKNVMKIDVPGIVVDWVAEKSQVGDRSLRELVDQYYRNRADTLYSDKFHFASRLWLWTHDSWAREQLDDLQAEFIGTTPEAIEAKIVAMIEKSKTQPLSINQNKAHRKRAYESHPQLPLYNSLLFKVVFCDSVYGLDLRPYIRKYIDDTQFLKAFDALIADGDSVRLLSTHAINFFYLLKNYFKGTLSLSSAVLVSPYELIDLLPGYDDLVRQGVINRATSIKLQIYLLTHAIIGESKFYASRVKGSAYVALCKEIERLIEENYYDVSLDNKFEFLVCAAICGYTSPLQSMIFQEAEKSLSWAGNFIVDTFNSFESSTSHCLRTSEHRNVLFLMASQAFVQQSKEVEADEAAQKPAKLKRIGRLAHVSLPSYGIRRAVARVDSGASHSAIAASNVYVDEAGLHFTLMDEKNHLYSGEEYVVTDYERMNIKNSSATQTRYAVSLDIVVNDKLHSVVFTLANRTNMIYPVLLGRNFLTGKYIVDTSKQFVRVKRATKSKELK